MITKDDILKLITEMNLHEDPAKIQSDQLFRNQGIDSLDVTTLYFEVEERFKVQLAEEDEEKYNTIDSMLKYINAK